MKLGISTDYAGELSVVEQTEDCLKQIAEAGFTHMHWCFEWDGDYIYSRYEMEQIREWMDKYGLQAKSLHASKGSRGSGRGRLEPHFRKDYTSTVEYNRIAGVELIKNRVELANVLGTTEMVLHMYLPYLDFIEKPETKEIFYGQVYKSLDELQDFCLEKNVRICLENLFEAPGELQIEQFDRLFAHYPKEFLGLCLDTGHANLVWGKDFITKFADHFKDRLYSIHVHDNFGWGGQDGCGDAHRLPGEGNIDWKALMQVLKQSAYEGPYVLEINKPAQEDARDYLKRALAAAEKYLKTE